MFNLEKKTRNDAFSLYDLYGHAPAREPLPRGLYVYNFGRSFFGHHNYTLILSLSVLCLAVEKKAFKEIMNFHYMTYMATPLQKNPKGHEIYKFGRPFLGHH